MSIARAHQEIDAQEYAYWKVYCERFEPFGREWEAVAQICFLIATAWMPKESGGWDMLDLMPINDEAKRRIRTANQKTPEEIEADMARMARG